MAIPILAAAGAAGGGAAAGGAGGAAAGGAAAGGGWLGKLGGMLGGGGKSEDGEGKMARGSKAILDTVKSAQDVAAQQLAAASGTAAQAAPSLPEKLAIPEEGEEEARPAELPIVKAAPDGSGATDKGRWFGSDGPVLTAIRNAKAKDKAKKVGADVSTRGY